MAEKEHQEPETQISTSPEKTTKGGTWAWVLASLALVVLLTVAIIINQNHTGSNTGNEVASAMDIDNGDLKINWNRYATYDVELNSTYTITTPGTYHFTGTLDDGAIIVKVSSEDAVKIILDNVTIKNSSGPAIACLSGDDLVIELVGENNLSDASSYSADYDEDVTGTIYSKADLTFQGEGSLNLAANYQDGIIGKDDLKFINGTYNISAADDAIRGKDSVYIVDGIFNVTAKEDAIKSTNYSTAGKGFVLIENGNLTIAAGDDAIHAETILMIQDGKINITKSYEGLEAPKIIINGGDVSVVANDDGINAGSSSDNTTTTQANTMVADTNCEIIVNGGNLYVNAAGDGIDSNGYIYFNGGTVVVDGPVNNGNGALDAGAGITMNGGKVITVGSSGMAETLGSTSAINNISVYFSTSQKAGTTITIKDTTGEVVLEHTSAKAFNHMAAGTEAFVLGGTYTIYIDGSEYQSFTVDSVTTTIGNSNANYNNAGGGQMRR
ncbi:carbohydrate-binding domain-containing protein [Candidatus Saccharibacteria bacterium]|nr:carbohydrate-binding domain-containing protein [Candidatus Saccharibacteria bacterium]